MSVLQTSKLNIDPNGMELVAYHSLNEQIIFYLDELCNYDQGMIQWHWHPQFELVLAKTRTMICVGEEQVVLQPGDGLWINAGQLHMFRAAEAGEGAVFYTILLQPEYIAAADTLIYQKYVKPMTAHGAASCVVLRPREPWQGRVLLALRQAMDAQLQQSAGYELAVRNHICDAWLEILGHMEQPAGLPDGKKSAQQQDRLKAMLTFLHENYMKPVSLEQIAASAHISKSECLRCFREHLGASPIQYLTGHRMQVAAHLLSTTGDSVQQIAAKCGYEDAGYFGRVFRSVRRMTPLAYRKQKGGAP